MNNDKFVCLGMNDGGYFFGATAEEAVENMKQNNGCDEECWEVFELPKALFAVSQSFDKYKKVKVK